MELPYPNFQAYVYYIYHTATRSLWASGGWSQPSNRKIRSDCRHLPATLDYILQAPPNEEHKFVIKNRLGWSGLGASRHCSSHLKLHFLDSILPAALRKLHSACRTGCCSPPNTVWKHDYMPPTTNEIMLVGPCYEGLHIINWGASTEQKTQGVGG